MSKVMLNDSYLMDGINPYVRRSEMSVPGIRRAPFDFQEYKKPEETPFKYPDPSPICDYGITTPGWRTKDMCRPTKPNCFDSRPLVPGRNIDRGLSNTEKREIMNKEKFKTKKQYGNTTQYIYIALIILVLFLLISRF